MASNGTSLRFQVEVTADQAEGKLAALTAAFNAAGISATTSFRGISKAAQESGRDLQALQDKYAALSLTKGNEALAQRYLAMNKEYARELALTDGHGKLTLDVMARYAEQERALMEQINGGGSSSALVGAGEKSKIAASGISVLRKEMGHARSTAMFFTQSLSEFGPQGRTAQIALAGITGAIIGGGGVLLALSLAQAAVRLVADAWEDASAESRKAAEESRKASDQIRSDTTRMADEVAANRLKLAGGTGAMEFLRTDVGPLRQSVELQRKLLGDAQEELNMWLSGAAVKDGIVQTQTRDRESAALEVKRVQALLGDLEKKLGIAQDKFRTLVQLEEQAATSTSRASPSEFQVESDQPSARSFLPENPFAGIDDTKTVTDPFAGYQKGATDAYVATIKLGYANQQMAEQSAKDWAATGQVYGSIFGAMATGQMTVMQGLAAMGQQMVAMITQLAIQSITASASKAGAEAAASQAGIPGIGPALAIGAMGAMVSAVLGLIGNIHSAAGGFDVGSFAPMTQLHPREMVLPAPLAERVRSMTGGGGGTVNVVINATDAKSVRRLLLENDDALAEAFVRARKKGRLS